MIVPVLNKKSTAQELANLCWLLNELKTTCEDSNIRWKIAQLAGEAEEVQEKFLDEFNLLPIQPSTYYNDIFEKLSASDRTETMLSFAFQSGATMDYARYEKFEPGKEFIDKIKSITKETLHLLHEKKGRRNEED